MRKIFYLSLLIVTVVITSCSKDKKVNPDGSKLDLIKDSVYLYAQQVYYWNESLPTIAAFKPRSFTGSNDIDALQNEIDAMAQYSKNPDNSNRSYEYDGTSSGFAKYSFIDDGSVSGELNGVKGDFGFAPFWMDYNDLRVKYIYPGSPADVNGIKRGYKITAINGRTGTGLQFDGNGGNNANVNFVINAYARSNSITLTLEKPDGSSFNVTMATGTYTVNPVLATKVIDAGGGKKIGYIVFNSFTSSANAKPKLDAAFGTFASAGITDLVVDLRYNGGGYVSTAEYLSNLIVPSSKNGTTMYKTFYTKQITNNTATILKNQIRRDEDSGQLYDYLDLYNYFANNNVTSFQKSSITSSLNLNNVFFIVTGSTASASELTINNLLPVMNVKLIGNTTYGKPVGFFDIKINKYEMYIPEFETKNSLGNGGYYEGMEPGTPKYAGKLDDDDVTKEFGDPTEKLLAYAINYVKNGTFALSQQQVQSLAKHTTFSIDQSRQAGLRVEGKQFRGMIYNNKKARR